MKNVSKQVSVNLQSPQLAELEPTTEERIGMENLPALNVTAKELEEILVNMGADIQHPVKLDPTATINGKFSGFWTE